MTESRKHLIVFGSGYVGGAFAREALARGWRVTALTRNAGTAAELAALGAEAVVADLAGDEWHARISGPADLVLDSVASGRQGVEGYRRSYLGGMRSIVRWGRTCRPGGVFMYTSSTSVYPQGAGEVVSETARVGSEDERTELLVQAEAALWPGAVAAAPEKAAGVHGFARVTILRLAGIYGPRRHQLLDQVRNGVVNGVGEHRLNVVHRDDVCTAIWAVFAAPPDAGDEVFNVVDDEPTRKAEVAGWLAERLGVPAPTFTGAAAEGRRRVTPDRVISNRKIKQVLGWKPRYPSFREGYENILSRTAD